jgi:CDP-glucose 4,6-dehydratase
MATRFKNWAGKTVFITGATGFLGSWLIKELIKNNANVVALVQKVSSEFLFYTDKLDKKCTVIFGSFLDFDLLQRTINEFNVNTVFHLGAQTIVGTANKSPLSTFETNIKGTWNILENCRLSPWVKKIIIASSDRAYGEHKSFSYTEETPMQGRYPYDVSKSCVDLLSQSYYHTYNLPVCVTRCVNLFGEGDQHLNRIIPGTITSVLSGQQPVIRSNGLLTRDYMYIKDAVNAYLTLAENMDDKKIIGQCFNFSTGNPLSVLEIVEKILVLMKTNIKPIIENKASNEATERYISSKKAHSLLNWKTKYKIDEGLQKTIEWYKSFFSTKKPTKRLEQRI